MKNLSNKTWVLVYDNSTKEVISIIEPGLNTETKFNLLEFNTKEELEKFIEGFIIENKLEDEPKKKIKLLFDTAYKLNEKKVAKISSI